MIGQLLTLPNGTTLTNRIVKSAMEEDLAVNGVPGLPHVTLYRRWAEGRPGMLITGNVVVDRSAPTDAGVVVLEDDKHMAAFRAWATAAKSYGSKVIMQINHPGRQIPKTLAPQPVAPSAIGVEVPGGRGLFNKPVALTGEQIEQQIARFETTARLGVEAGFDGIQIHAAHGYLISQFLSPLTNRRTDQWGGSLKNRARFLFRIVEATRRAIGSNAILSIKLNSADFQKGGFDETEASWVVEQLNGMGIDLLELSGGNYESPAMLTSKSNPREAFFIEFAEKLRAVATMPLMVTGGFRTREGLIQALESGAVDAVGLAKPFLLDPDLPRKMLNGDLEAVHWPVRKLKNQAFNSLLQMGWAKTQIERLGHGKAVNLRLGSRRTLVATIIKSQIANFRYRRWLKSAESQRGGAVDWSPTPDSESRDQEEIAKLR